ncbi:MAG: hypothetical protein F4039_04480 [Gammaproteobacteria bacterium]|nr:hypothetical protein [Gammaproteobacteria bacterium]MYF52954.1 hypothetical protein [Gammaproteobacteria bacterium]MYK43327.1 hypothetical protein [Gammaproteobacteria bacterium]
MEASTTSLKSKRDPGNLLRYIKYFKTIQNELAEKHHGKYVVICRDAVVGVFENAGIAFVEGKKKFPDERILIRECIHKEEEVPIVFRSRVR